MACMIKVVTILRLTGIKCYCALCKLLRLFNRNCSQQNSCVHWLKLDSNFWQHVKVVSNNIHYVYNYWLT